MKKLFMLILSVFTTIFTMACTKKCEVSVEDIRSTKSYCLDTTGNYFYKRDSGSWEDRSGESALTDMDEIEQFCIDRNGGLEEGVCKQTASGGGGGEEVVF